MDSAMPRRIDPMELVPSRESCRRVCRLYQTTILSSRPT